MRRHFHVRPEHFNSTIYSLSARSSYLSCYCPGSHIHVVTLILRLSYALTTNPKLLPVSSISNQSTLHRYKQAFRIQGYIELKFLQIFSPKWLVYFIYSDDTAITNKYWWSRRVRYNRVWLYYLLITDDRNWAMGPGQQGKVILTELSRDLGRELQAGSIADATLVWLKFSQYF